MEAIIFCGGKGSRLGSTEEEPKPMAMVAGRPMLEWVIRYAVSKGVKRIVLATGYGSAAVWDWFGAGKKFGCELLHIYEEKGTAAAFLRAQDHVWWGDGVMVLNGDTYCEWDVEKAQTNLGWVGVFTGREGEEVKHAGAIYLPNRIEWEVDVPERFEDLLAGATKQTIPVYRSAFWDIGTPEKLRKARNDLHLVLHIRFAEWEIMSLEMLVRKCRRAMAERIGAMGDQMRITLGNGNKVMVIGNGGSMADAMHFATELQNGLQKGEGKGGNRVMVLGSESPYLTARVNDYGDGAHTIFAKLVDAWAEKGDILVCLSSSGESENVVKAAELAIGRGCLVFAFTAELSRLAEVASETVAFPREAGTQRIQEMTYIALHALAGITEAGQ